MCDVVCTWKIVAPVPFKMLEALVECRVFRVSRVVVFSLGIKNFAERSTTANTLYFTVGEVKRVFEYSKRI